MQAISDDSSTSTATSDNRLESTGHCSDRQLERHISRHELQKLKKHGVYSPDPQGNPRRRKVEYSGLVAIIQDRNTVITTWSNAERHEHTTQTTAKFSVVPDDVDLGLNSVSAEASSEWKASSLSEEETHRYVSQLLPTIDEIYVYDENFVGFVHDDDQYDYSDLSWSYTWCLV